MEIKKALSFAIMFIMLMNILLPSFSFAEVYLTDDGYKYRVTDGNAEIISYSGKAVDVVIPNTLAGCSVTVIGSAAFGGNTCVKSIVVPNSVTAIGDHAFSDCKALESITLPNSISAVGTSLFFQCTALKDVTLPNNLTEISDRMFQYCRSLADITIPENVRRIGECAFEGCSSLESIIIPNGVTTIDNYAFSECSLLKSVTIPNSVSYIGREMFWGCHDELTIYGGSGSYSENYAKENNINFVAVPMEIAPEPIITPTVEPTIEPTIEPTVEPTTESTVEPTKAPSHTEVKVSEFTITVSDDTPKAGDIITVTVFMEKCNPYTNILKLVIPINTEAFELVGDAPVEFISDYWREQKEKDRIAYFNENRDAVYIEYDDESISLRTTLKTLATFRLKVKASGTVAIGEEETYLYNSHGDKEINWKQTAPEVNVCPDSTPIPQNEEIFEYEIVSDRARITRYNGNEKELVIPDTLDGYPVYAIAEYAFKWSDSLESVTTPDGMYKIEKGAFFDCDALKTVNIGDVTYMDDFVFAYCDSLETVRTECTMQWLNIGKEKDYLFYKSGDFTIHGLPSSWIEDYAKANNIPFVAIIKPAEIIKGDVTGDNKVNSRDISSLQKHIAGERIITDENALLLGDYYEDGKLNSRDIAMIQKKIIGAI